MEAFRLLSHNITNDNYKIFLNLCFRYCTQFTLTFHDYNITSNYPIKKELEPFYVKTIQTYHWYCYRTYEYPLSILVYRVNEEAKNILLKYYDNIYCKPNFNIEDICFFKNNHIFFGSVSHEEIAHLFLNHQHNQFSQFMKLANWKKENIDRNRFINFNYKSILQK